MKPIHGVRTVGKMGLHPRGEGPGHVGDSFDHLLGLAFVGDQVVLEGLQGLFALARNSENHRFCGLVKVNEHGDIAVSLAHFGFIETEGLGVLRSMAFMAVLT